MVDMNLTLRWKNKKNWPFGPNELDLEAGNLVFSYSKVYFGPKKGYCLGQGTFQQELNYQCEESQYDIRDKYFQKMLLY